MPGRRYAIALAAAALLLLAAAACAAAFPAAAVAHSALESSDPAAGSSVPASPSRIGLAFSEAPEVKVSMVKVLDSSGRSVPGISDPQAVAGDAEQLEVIPSQPLADGVYTVNYRVISAVDGHVLSGAFAFGVGQTPAPGSEIVVDLLRTSPWTSALAGAGRWLLYTGLVLLVGAASTSLLVYGGRLPRRGVVVLRSAAVAAVAGLCLMAWAGKEMVGAPVSCPSS